AGKMFGGLKSSTDDRPRCQHVEEPVGHVNRADALRLAASIGKVDLRIPPARDLVEETLLLTPIAVGDGRRLALLQAARQIALPNHDQAIRLLVSPRPDQRR